MANANDPYKPATFEGLYSNYAYPTPLFGKFTVGASGAVASQDLDRGYGTFTLTGTGAYTIPLASTWDLYLGFRGNALQASYSATGACDVKLVEDKTTDATTPEIKILVTKSDGTAVQPASGDVISWVLWVSPENVK